MDIMITKLVLYVKIVKTILIFAIHVMTDLLVYHVNQMKIDIWYKVCVDVMTVIIKMVIHTIAHHVITSA